MTINLVTGVYTPGDETPDGSKKLFGNLSWPDTQVGPATKPPSAKH
jgi:hypothetical protein